MTASLTWTLTAGLASVAGTGRAKVGTAVGLGRGVVSIGGELQREHWRAQWVDEPASDKLWMTARDGDVVLSTTGDGCSRGSESTPTLDGALPRRLTSR
jgi:hypothetical protein